ncbi:MAG: hypothetical protein ABI352_03190 [Candidatus Dormibacter sp.]
MGDSKAGVGRVLRFMASGGMAGEDPDVVAELLTTAHQLAEMVAADPSSSPDLRRTADTFLEQLASDTFGAY